MNSRACGNPVLGTETSVDRGMLLMFAVLEKLMLKYGVSHCRQLVGKLLTRLA